ncbi:TerB family tellurite resistance protein [Thiohalobacter sp.]|uniref:tellurite resistance TerB family protein n=1 Tax=Thiohalobacter sp. TaxID=2025948 RepID=UPI002626133C|nr:TerB family tellurite resistance protein [Thiohalobacter sp.]
MLKRLQRFFDARIRGALDSPDPLRHEQGLRLATAALLVEMMRADFDSSETERARILDLLTGRFGLDEVSAAELLELARAEAETAASLFQFTQLIDRHCLPEEKASLIEMLWEVAYADARLDKYEEHLVRKLSDLLHVPHREMLQAKHRVLDRLGSG